MELLLCFSFKDQILAYKDLEIQHSDNAECCIHCPQCPSSLSILIFNKPYILNRILFPGYIDNFRLL